MTDTPRHHTFSARLDCRYLLRVPEAIDSGTLLFVTLHGFGQTAEALLPLTERLVGTGHLIASLQGPNQFFLHGKTAEAGFGWGANRHAPSAIRLHHEMVLHVLDEAGSEHGIRPERRLLVGFSQAVALNYRFAATWPDAVRGVIGMCGGLPGDWETANYQRVKASVLHMARREDEFYPPAVTEHYTERLRLRVEDVEFHLLDGGHRFPSRGNGIVEGWLDRILK